MINSEHEFQLSAMLENTAVDSWSDRLIVYKVHLLFLLHKRQVMHSPNMADIRRIGLINNAVLRNVLITQSYYELSQMIMSRTGSVANWCTFATWASKQAGQSIRKEDLQRTLEVRVDIELLKEFQAHIAIAAEMGIGSSINSRLHVLVFRH
jgi:hypothetical protein